jgi:hypothetical protein
MYQRSRFSIGHELGHWMKHRGSVGKLCNKESIVTNKSSRKNKLNGKEVIANKFASELLMPNYLVLNLIKGNDISLSNILSIKDAFDVSFTAAAIKYIDICDFPVILACYHYERGRRWFHRSKQVPESFYPLNVFDQTSPGYSDISKSNNNYTSREVDANTWVNYRGSENHEVMEVVWPISDYEFMVLFWWHDEEQIIDYF